MADIIKVSPSKILEYRDYFDLLLITATPTEKDEVHKFLEPVEGESGVLRIQKDQYTYYLGKFGHYNAIHVATGNMGAIGRGASLTTALAAINLWHPKAVVMVGIAFGANHVKQKIGDVLVAERVVNYETYRANPDGSATQRGAEGAASTMLLDRYRSVDGWKQVIKYGDQEYVARQISGLILSGEILLDNEELKAKFLADYPTAIGGEMEGAGIYAACDGKVNHWILAKAICDFGDGTKSTDPNKNLYQELAIQSAVSLSYAVFSDEYAFEDIGLFSGPLKTEDTATVEVGEKKKFSEFLMEQINRQLNKQKATQKYIPSTFVEVGDNKEMLRFFSSPVTFLPKLLNELSVMEFEQLNLMLVEEGFEEFEFDISSFTALFQTLELANIDNYVKDLRNYLETKAVQLENPPVASNSMRSYSNKVSYVCKQLKWFSAKVTLIKEDAGQGKTNFLCDLVDNFILKRSIPSLFLLGTDIDPADVRTSILKKAFPDLTDLSFAQFLDSLQAHCSSTNQPFILIIDGLNENANPNLLSKNLEDFISEMTENNFIRIIISCRSEYYQKHFSNFNKAVFSSLMKEVRTLRIHNDRITANKIFWGYMHHFNIEIATYNTGVFRQLTQNFLLLRIFCDSHQSEKIQYLGSIQKQALFERYYQNKVEEITVRMNADDELRVMGKIDIRRFLETLISYMIGHKTYENIPFENLLNKDDNHKVYIRFLDENILVRRDPTTASSVFAAYEVVNFTFDEFRDYLIADYLINKTYTENVEQFLEFLENEINPSARILEGCGTFLFYIARKSNDQVLKSIIESQSWYSSIFLRCIFNLEDNYVLEQDREDIFNHIRKKGRPSISIFYQFLRRSNIAETPNLNLGHYVSFLRDLESAEFEVIFTRMFVDTEYAIYGEIKQEQFLGEYSSFFSDKDINLIPEDFEILIYMFNNPSHWSVFATYELFFHRFPAVAKVQLQNAMTSGNSDLKNSINRFCTRYDFSL